MHINKYLLWISSVAILGSIWWLSAGTLNINNSNFDKWLPIFKTIFFRSEGKDVINGSTNPEGIRLDNSGIYTRVPNALPGGSSNVLKLNWARQIYMNPVENDNFATDSISNIKIMDNSIINSNFIDLAITNSQIRNNTIEITKFDPGITWPSGGTMYITNNVCAGLNAIISVNNGTATCALLPTGATTLPTCSEWQRPVFSGGARTCQTILLWGWASDPYRTWSLSWYIKNSNAWNVWVWLDNPGETLTVSGSLEVLWQTEDQVYCYATDTWVWLGAYNAWACAWCNVWFHYNSTTQLCEQSSCVGTWPTMINGACGSANGGTFAIAPTANLCSAWTTGAVAWSGPWTWTCYGTGGGSNAACSANITSNNTCGWYAGPIYVKRTLINNQYNSRNSDPYCGWRPNGQHSDVWDCQYEFYSDAAATMPVSVTNLIVDTDTSVSCNYGSCIWGWAGSFVANGTSVIRPNCKTDMVEDFPPGWCGAWYAQETTMMNSSCAQETVWGGGPVTCAWDITLEWPWTSGSPGHRNWHMQYSWVYHSEIIRGRARATQPNPYNRLFTINAGTGPQSSASANVPDNLTDFEFIVTPTSIWGQPLCMNGTPIIGWGDWDNIYITNRGAYNSQINDINSNGAQFFAITNWSYPLSMSQDIAWVHGWLSANEMDYDITSSSPFCLYTFINNPSGAAAWGCNPWWFDQQTQGMAWGQYGTIYAPAFSSSDRVDIVVCDWICN